MTVLNSRRTIFESILLMLQAIKLVISGQVQQVGYRWFAVQEASSRGIVGYVCNLANGSVEVVAQGDSGALSIFYEKLRNGPKLARVDDVTVTAMPIEKERVVFRVRVEETGRKNGTISTINS